MPGGSSPGLSTDHDSLSAWGVSEPFPLGWGSLRSTGGTARGPRRLFLLLLFFFRLHWALVVVLGLLYLQHMDLSSPVQDRTLTPALEGRFLGPGPPGTPPGRLFRGKQAQLVLGGPPGCRRCLPPSSGASRRWRPVLSEPAEQNRALRLPGLFAHCSLHLLSFPCSPTRGLVRSAPGQPSPPDRAASI